MTGSAAAYAWNDKSVSGQSSGVFSWGSESSLHAASSWSGSKTRTLNFNGSSGFSGYTASAGSHDHSRGTIGNSMTGSFTTYMCHAYHSASGVFNGSKNGGFKWAGGGYFDATQYNFNGSSGFSGCLLI